MSYVSIQDWKFGMDRRRKRSSGVPGTLWTLKNGFINRGGDIERAKKFVEEHSLPSGTFGCFSVRSQLYVFGSASTPAGMPVGVQYQQLAAPSTPNMTEVLDAKGFDGKAYVVAAYDNGNIYHFYDGSRVTAWDTLADAAFTYSTVASRLAEIINAQDDFRARAAGNVVEITASVAGTAFTISTSTSDVDSDSSAPTATATQLQANVAAVAETRASGTVTITGGSASAGVNTISSVTVDGVELLIDPVDWVSSNDATANALAVAINDNSFASNYSATAAGAVVTIKAAVGTGATPNGDVVAATTTGDVTASTADMASGVTAVDAVAQVYKVVISGTTPDSTDLWTITLDGVAYKTTGRASATGTSIHVNRRRVYSTAGSLLYYSKLTDPTDWSDADASSGAGFINMANEVEGADTLVGAAKYQSYTAVFARNTVIIYDLQSDASQSQLVQALDNTGTLAPRAIVPYGSDDVYYPDATGIRSLKVRDTYNAAYASDVGSALDPFVQDIIAEEGDALASRASAVIEATDGRYMLAIGQYVICLSQFPASKIVAWSYIDFGAVITDIVRADRTIYLRAGDTIYIYGGVTGDVYPDEDEFPVIAETPFVSAKDPATHKQLLGFDMAAENTWHVEILTDPNDTTRAIDAGYLEGTTYHRPQIKLPGNTSHFAQRFTCAAAGAASLSSTAVHYEPGEQG